MLCVMEQDAEHQHSLVQVDVLDNDLTKQMPTAILLNGTQSRVLQVEVYDTQIANC